MKKKTITISEDTEIKIVLNQENSEMNLSVKEVSDILGISISRLKPLIRNGILETGRKGARYICGKSVLNYLKNNPKI